MIFQDIHFNVVDEVKIVKKKNNQQMLTKMVECNNVANGIVFCRWVHSKNNLSVTMG